jgi:hypothetical protein
MNPTSIGVWYLSPVPIIRKIVLVHFPFTDLTTTKLHPALILHESTDDVVVAFISLWGIPEMLWSFYYIL